MKVGIMNKLTMSIKSYALLNQLYHTPPYIITGSSERYTLSWFEFSYLFTLYEVIFINFMLFSREIKHRKVCVHLFYYVLSSIQNIVHIYPLKPNIYFPLVSCRLLGVYTTASRNQP